MWFSASFIFLFCVWHLRSYIANNLVRGLSSELRLVVVTHVHIVTALVGVFSSGMSCTVDNAPHSVISATLGGVNEIPLRLIATGGQKGAVCRIGPEFVDTKNVLTQYGCRCYIITLL